MRLLLQTHYVGTRDDPCEITHVLVDIDPRHQLDMRVRLSDVMALPQLYSVTFVDDTPQPVLCDFCDEEPEWFDEDAEAMTLPTDASLPAADLQIAAPTINYMPDGIMWHFYELHGGEVCETATIPWHVLQAAAKQQGAKNGKDQILHTDRSRNR